MPKIKKTVLFIIAAVAVVYVVLVIIRMFHFYNLQKTEEEVAKIHATKLTLDDVMGKNLPPDPGVLADKTIAGIDANQNGIRDDVELVIFKEYPNSAKTRAVLLQYALALQMEVTQIVVNKETVTAVVEVGDRASNCLRDSISDPDTEKYLATLHSHENFVKQRQVNTDERKKYQNDFYQHLGSYTSPREGCDLDISTL